LALSKLDVVENADEEDLDGRLGGSHGDVLR
jgi:hypothetical protein